MTSTTFDFLKKNLIKGRRFRWLNGTYYHVESIDWETCRIVCFELQSNGKPWVVSVDGVSAITNGTNIHRLQAELTEGEKIVHRDGQSYTVVTVMWDARQVLVRTGGGGEKIIYIYNIKRVLSKKAMLLATLPKVPTGATPPIRRRKSAEPTLPPKRVRPVVQHVAPPTLPPRRVRPTVA